MSTPYQPFPGAETYADITGDQVINIGASSPIYAPLDGAGGAFVDASGALFYWSPDGKLVTEPVQTYPTSHTTLAPWLGGASPVVASPAHPLDSAPDGTAIVKTDAGTVTIPKGQTGSEPDPTDALHAADLPPKTTLVKTPQGIEVNAPLPPELHASLGKRALWAVERDVKAAIAWAEQEWEKVTHRGA